MVSTASQPQPPAFCSDTQHPVPRIPLKSGITPSPGLTSEGIYRKCGQTSKTQRLLDSLRQDARSVHLKEGEQHVDDVSSALKRFLRDLPDGLFTRAQRLAWLEASGGSCCLHPSLSSLPTSGCPHHTLDKDCPSSSAYSASGSSSHSVEMELLRGGGWYSLSLLGASDAVSVTRGKAAGRGNW